jgi:glycerol-3-phosphate responsive antiterminator
MENNYSISEILSAVDEIQNKKKEKIFKVDKVKPVQNDNSGIPFNTLQLIEEAERIKR